MEIEFHKKSGNQNIERDGNLKEFYWIHAYACE